MPAQFWALTVRQFWIKYRAFIRAENRQLRRMAQSALMTDGDKYKKHMRTPEKLLGAGGRPMNLYPVKKWIARG